MDISFSDHYLAHPTLEQLGAVVKTINMATEDKALRFYSFVYYVSENHPSILQYTPPETEGGKIRLLLSKLELPPVEIIGGRRTKTPTDETGDVNRKEWWQFWKRGP
ncbi:MAG: hypothetical protein H8F28_17670 [Fibrella sp.]|nr:hypothetical protein [Armatimonadota bacterium]